VPYVYFIIIIIIITIIFLNYTLFCQHVNEVRIDLLLLFMYYLFICL